jgi:hypothetical protein
MIGQESELHLIGDDSFQHEYIPGLPTGDIRDLFDKIPVNGPWTLPSYASNHGLLETEESYGKKWDSRLGEWIMYLDQVARGLQLHDRSAEKGIVMGESTDSDAYLYFENGGIDVTLQNIRSVKRTFAALLSPDARKELRIKKSRKAPSEEDIQNARKVVDNFYKVD